MNILVVNLHAMSNRGDAAIAFVTLDLLREAFPGAQIAFAANHPAEFAGLGVEVLPAFKTWVWSSDADGRPRWHYAQLPLLALAALNLALCRLTGRAWLPWPAERARLLRAYLRADMVVGCGGNTIYARRALALAFWVICFSLWCGALCGAALVGLPQTIGPFFSRAHALGARLALRRARTLMLRDSESQRVATAQLRLSPQRCQLTPDLALLLGPIAGPPAPRDARLVGISALDWQAQYPYFKRQEAYEAALAGAVARLARLGYRVAFFRQSDTATHGEDDGVPAQRIIDRLSPEARAAVVGILSVPAAADAIRGFYGQFQLVIATRLHATILALVAGTPVVPIAYTSKSWGFVRDYGLEQLTSAIETVTERELAERAVALLARYDYWSREYQAELHARLRDERAQILDLLRAAAR